MTAQVDVHDVEPTARREVVDHVAVGLPTARQAVQQDDGFGPWHSDTVERDPLATREIDQHRRMIRRGRRRGCVGPGS